MHAFDAVTSSLNVELDQEAAAKIKEDTPCRYDVTLCWRYLLNFPNSQVSSHLKTALLWRLNCADNKNMYFHFHVKCSIL